MGSNLSLAANLVQWFLRSGAREIVLCAGARNLALVAAATKTAGIKTWHHPEERSAGFFAMGRAKASGRPVAIVVTSGTAVAELLPAVIEAHYQGIPLVVISADRPACYRETGSPQTIEQRGIFGPHAAFLGEFEAGDSSELPADQMIDRPVHLNVCFDEPILDGLLEQNIAPATNSLACPISVEKLQSPPAWDDFGSTGKILVMVGALSSAERASVLRFLEKLGAPVWLEATSGLWGQPGLSRLWVRNPAKLPAEGPTHVLRLGGVPCDRLWRDLEKRDEIQVRSWSSQGWPGLARPCENAICDLSQLRTGSIKPHSNWSTEASRFPVPSANIPCSETAWFGALSRHIPDDALVFLGNSLPIREWQAAADWRVGLEIHANRGVNGIDGEISTFLGLAADHPAESWGIFGDLTTLYDLAGPWILSQMPGRVVRFVVVNNGGGAIFRDLPALRAAEAATREIVCNEHSLDFAGWASLWRLPYVRLEDPVNWSSFLPEGSCVLEIVPKRDQ
ncbi:MAG: 2-succinyl-5-enolpyruvyl-6-hydroxy-3-cyclohexene-1-carboxylic-acid synthase [Verrucomicrobiales bacterium]